MRRLWLCFYHGSTKKKKLGAKLRKGKDNSSAILRVTYNNLSFRQLKHRIGGLSRDQSHKSSLKKWLVDASFFCLLSTSLLFFLIVVEQLSLWEEKKKRNSRSLMRFPFLSFSLALFCLACRQDEERRGEKGDSFLYLPPFDRHWWKNKNNKKNGLVFFTSRLIVKILCKMIDFGVDKISS